MSEVNIPLLRKAVEWAEAEAAVTDPFKRRWIQNFWFSAPDTVARVAAREVSGWTDDSLAEEMTPACGTAYCVAGWVAHNAGWTDDEIENGQNGEDVADFAAAQLGISEYYGARYEEHLFAHNNTIEDVRRIADEIAGEPL